MRYPTTRKATICLYRAREIDLCYEPHARRSHKLPELVLQSMHVVAVCKRLRLSQFCCVSLQALGGAAPPNLQRHLESLSTLSTLPSILDMGRTIFSTDPGNIAEPAFFERSGQLPR